MKPLPQAGSVANWNKREKIQMKRKACKPA
jgi:hypothetical protein